jgi:hypothetical protein
MKSLAYVTLFALALTPSYGFAQERGGHKMSDEELITLSLSAAPEAIAKSATVVAMDHDGKMRAVHRAVAGSVQRDISCVRKIRSLSEAKQTSCGPQDRLARSKVTQSGSRAAYFSAMHILRLRSNKYDRVPL